MSVEIPVTDASTQGRLHVPARFQIKGELGRGGMAVVYRAYDTAGEREVALKFLPPTDDENNRRRFQREAVDLAGVYHPNIVDFYSLGESSGQEFIEMEYVAGGTLGKFQRNCDSLRTLLEVYARICEGLAHIHESGLVHRDIKPANILMTLEGEPKISDLGLARREAGRTQLTQEGTILGTASYLAPEQLMSHAVGPAADVYALGVCLFEAACCRPPFQAATPLAMVRAHVQDPPPKPSILMPGLPLELETLILSMLEKSPEKRPQDLKEVALELRKIGSRLSDQQDALVASSGEALLGRARQYRSSGEFEQARQLLEQVEEKADRPFQLQARCEKIRLLLLQDRVGALELAEEVVGECRESNDIKALGAALVLHGRAALAEKQWEAAQRSLQEARELVPSNNYELQVELLGALADLHEEGSQAGVETLSEEKSRRFREIALGLQRRQESSVSSVIKEPVAPGPTPPVKEQISSPASAPKSTTSSPARARRFLVPGLALLLLLGAVGGVYQWFVNRPSALEIESSPTGATVLVNAERFPAPYKGELAPGTYQVKVFLQGYHPWEQELELQAGGSVTVVASLKPASGNLNLTSNPAGAKVFVNGQERGKTPVELTGLAIDSYRIKLVREGYKPHEETIEVHGGKTRNLQFSMQKIPPPPPPQPVYRSYSGGSASGNRSSGGGSYRAPSRPAGQSRSQNYRAPQVKVDIPSNFSRPKVRLSF